MERRVTGIQAKRRVKVNADQIQQDLAVKMEENKRQIKRNVFWRERIFESEGKRRKSERKRE